MLSHIHYEGMFRKLSISCSSLGLYGLPKRNGKLKDISHFDAAFFGVHAKQANTMDPQLRIMMEVAYEAVIDAGKNQSEEAQYCWRAEDIYE